MRGLSILALMMAGFAVAILAAFGWHYGDAGVVVFFGVVVMAWSSLAGWMARASGFQPVLN